MKINRIKILITLLLISTLLVAHGSHKKKKGMMDKQDTLTIVAGDTIAINGVATAEFIAEKKELNAQEVTQSENEEADEVENGKEITLGALFEHIHNKVIHFPIALSIIGFILMLLGYKNEKYLPALKIIIPFATIVTVVALFAGLSQATAFEGTSTYKLVVVHQYLGFAVLTFLVLWSLSLFVEKMKKFIWLFAVLTILLVSIAGFYGGVIAH